MTPAGTQTIRSLFSMHRPIDRPIEKVIDYYATDPARLQAEIDEYEVTQSVERNLQRFLDVFDEGVRGGQVTESGIWVSGFYGSGKSSFTKYLGFALDPDRDVNGRPFLDLFAERIDSVTVRQLLRRLAAQEPVAVVMLDLGSEQLASSSTAEVSRVLYWKVLQWAGYSRVEKVAHLELLLERDGKYDEFQRRYEEQFGEQWQRVHNDPLIGVRRADQLVPYFYPQEYPEPGAFSALRYTMALDAREQAREMLDLVHRRSGRRNVLFLVDEVGQYVAPRGELILNLDGLARNLKELGKGRVWVVATGQQTLAEIVERAAYNSTELNKLRDRFPISIELDARDIREITHRRLLAKSPEGEQRLRDLFHRHGSALATHTRLTGTVLFKADPDAESFIKYYPFLPQHFDLLMELIGKLARSRGGVGLRSAIRVIQDLLVDASKALPPGTPLLADQPMGTLATADGFYDTLRADINKVDGHLVTAVDRIERAFADDALAIRAGKAIAVLQLLEGFPRTAENVAALLYRSVGDAPHLDAVRAVINRLLQSPESGLVDDPQTGGYSFLSDAVKELVRRRNEYQPTTAELAIQRSTLLRDILTPPPSAVIEANKTVRAGTRLQRQPLFGDDEEIQFQIEPLSGGNWEERRTALLTETSGTSREWQNVIIWLIQPSEAIEDTLIEIIRSDKVVREIPESDADKDVAQFVRAERRLRDANLDLARKRYRDAFMEGTLIFRGKPTAAATAGVDVESAARRLLGEAGIEIYQKYHLVNIRPSTDLAAKFLSVERLDRMPADTDPLRFIKHTAGQPTVDLAHPALAEALRALGRPAEPRAIEPNQGNALQDTFAAAPYGWSKDATRYVFAGLLLAGEIVLFTPAGEVKSPGPAAIDAFKNTQSFNKVGVALRGARPKADELVRAAERLKELTGEMVMPLENRISQIARDRLPERLNPLQSLPIRLQHLGLAGADRAQALIDTGMALLAGDGSGAVGILGAAACSFPDDVRWAEKVLQVLEAGGADDVQLARTVLSRVDDLERYAPDQSLAIADARRAIEDALGSEAFADRLATLRQAVRAIQQQVAERYRREAAAYETAVTAARQRLEAHPGWLRLEDEDRAEIIGLLEHAAASGATNATALEALLPLLFQQARLPGEEAKLLKEIVNRQPDDPLVVNGRALSVSVTIDGEEVAGHLTSEADIDQWLSEVRARLTSALQAQAVEMAR